MKDRLYDAAVRLLEKRYPTGWGGAAAMLTADGHVLTSVAPEAFNASAELCIETGAICEAHKHNAVVTHTLCMVREDEFSAIRILPPCGICQERLFYWGGAVEAAVKIEGDEPLYRPLKDLQPYYWHDVYVQAKSGAKGRTVDGQGSTGI